jgi:acetyl esterase/lipase
MAPLPASGVPAAAARAPQRLIGPRSSLRSRGLNRLLRWLNGSPLRHDTDLTRLRQRYEALDARHVRLQPSVHRTRVDCDGVAAEWIRVPESRPGRTLLLLHGGSFTFRFPNTHAAFAARLCRRLGAQALLPDYRLAPEHPYPAAPDDCETAYRWLQAAGCQPADLVVLGDSAGGNLALVTMLRGLRASLPRPACGVLLSPAVDCTLASPSMSENTHRDPGLRLDDLVLLRSRYVPSPRLYTDPDVSPLFADLRGLPPLLLQAGRSELLRDEAVRTADKAHAAGVAVELELWPDTAHGFQMAPFLPEAGLALDQIARFVRARAGW